MHYAACQEPEPSFAREVALALRHGGFAAPAEDEARVLVFDSAPWWPWQTDAAERLTPAEQARSWRFHHDRDRRTYVLAHACWRIALGEVLGCDTRDVALASSASGQPRLPGTAFATSLSHSGSHVAIAVARAPIVGVDIECSPTRTSLRAIEDMLCTPGEALAMRALPDDARTTAMLALWTRKEALLKAFGIGLCVTPSAIAAPGQHAIDPPLAAAGMPACRIHALPLPAGLLGAIAAPLAVARIHVHGLARAS
ncbi:4'-phosphopantetheinyl transferase family protein [Dyella sedimenti]|uniref:4'-phosphopantetheinyl transferase family protein n=1 Tax=Dyella sedimenti TaxID=2919947 RepID=UPI001FAA20FE|nr:4'-phosphopantetheinyl transferase superfamily protein [Dyella sedimenti]